MPTYEIPLIASAQSFTVTLVGVTYNFALNYRKADASVFGAPTGADREVPGLIIDTNILDTWVLDISDASNNPLVCGIPLIPGIDLLGQYEYLGFGGALTVAVSGDADGVPDFAGLGTSGKMFFTPR